MAKSKNRATQGGATRNPRAARRSRLAVSHIEKQFGKGAIQTMGGDGVIARSPHFSSGGRASTSRSGSGAIRVAA